MTPKEKAEELVFKYFDVEDSNDYDSRCCINLYASKQCALIAVDEIRNNVLIYIDICYQWGNYWDEVKEEIIKL